MSYFSRYWADLADVLRSEVGIRVCEQVEWSIAQNIGQIGPVAAELKMEISKRLEQPDENKKNRDSSEPDLLDDSDYSVVWGVLAYDPKPVDLIIEQTGLSAREISSMLLMMELKGMIKKQSGGRYVRA